MMWSEYLCTSSCCGFSLDGMITARLDIVTCRSHPRAREGASVYEALGHELFIFDGDEGLILRGGARLGGPQLVSWFRS